MFSKNVYKEARRVGEVIGCLAFIGIVGGLIYGFIHTESESGFVVAFFSALLLLVAYICALVSHIGENIAAVVKTEDAKPTEKESFNRLMQKVKQSDKTDKS